MLLSLLALNGFAQDTWSEPHPGISLLERTTSNQQITAAYVDLCTDGLAARATTYDERGQRTSTWGADVGALVAVNGSFFAYADYDAIGWSIGQGASWPTAVDYPDYTAIGFDDRGVAEVFDASIALPPPGDWRQMVPGNRLLLDDGAIVSEACFSHMCERHPRTAVGLTADGEQVILAVVDGRQPGMAGMTRTELAGLMLDLGAWRALNLDGGGSSTLWVAGQGVVNSPSDGTERVVANHLGFLQGPGGLTCCRPEEVDGATGVFGDIEDSHWARGYAEALYADGITAGCQADPLLFCPDCVLTRAQLAVMVARAMGLAPSEARTFSDVPEDAWYAGHVEALREAGITSGCATDRFCPDDVATRVQLAAFVRRGMGLPAGTDTGRFTDLVAWQAAEVEPLAEACVVDGCAADAFCPNAEATRAQAAKLLAVGFAVGGYEPCLEEPEDPSGPDTPGDEPGPADPDAPQGPGQDGAGADDPGASEDPDMMRMGGGCGCATGAPAAPGWLLGALGWLCWRRRR